MSQWLPSQRGQFLAYLPFTPNTWERSARLLLGEEESQYWTKCHVNPYETEEGLEFAIDRLVEHGRPHEAIRCLERLRHEKRPLGNQQVVHVLCAVLHSAEAAHTIDAYSIVEIIQALQDDPETNPDDLFKVEWAFLPILNQHHRASPKLLEQRLANDPDFFCEVIRLVFRSKKAEKTTCEATEQQKSLAENAYRLLSEWKLPPGSRKDGTFDGEELVAWLKKVKTSCAESGHLDIALSKLGEVLIHTPPDSDSLWIHHTAARVLNAKESEPMRNGFQTALFNTRGVHTWTAGREERELAEKYRARAEAVESHGYHRLAGALRDLANSYERDAERQASRDPFDD